MIDMRVRYQPVRCGDGPAEIYSKRGFFHRNSFRLVLLVIMIISISLFSAGIFSYILEEDFTKFKYPLDINNVHGLIGSIDKTLLNDESLSKTKNYSTVIEAIDRITESNPSWSNITPLTQFKGLNFDLDVQPTCREQWKQSSRSKGLDFINMVVVVKSAVNNYARRAAIRESWYLNGTHNMFSFKTVFMVGRCHEINPLPPSITQTNKSWTKDDCNLSIRKESMIYEDIIQSSGIDSYYNNTIKTFMTLRWLSERCETDFVLAIDDDYVLEVDNLIEYMIELSFYRTSVTHVHEIVRLTHNSSLTGGGLLDTIKHEDETLNESIHPAFADNKKNITIRNLRNLSNGYLYAGFMRDHVHPYRIVMTKWYITRKEYAYNKYPRFITGGAVLMSFETVRHMYYATYFTNSFKFDDVYIGILAMKLGIEPTHEENFMCSLNYYIDCNPIRSNSTRCIGVHDIEPEELLKLWSNRRNMLSKDQIEISLS